MSSGITMDNKASVVFDFRCPKSQPLTILFQWFEVRYSHSVKNTGHQNDTWFSKTDSSLISLSITSLTNPKNVLESSGDELKI